jgi:hypothetical protein
MFKKNDSQHILRKNVTEGIIHRLKVQILTSD